MRSQRVTPPHIPKRCSLYFSCLFELTTERHRKQWRKRGSDYNNVPRRVTEFLRSGAGFWSWSFFSDYRDKLIEVPPLLLMKKIMIFFLFVANKTVCVCVTWNMRKQRKPDEPTPAIWNFVIFFSLDECTAAWTSARWVSQAYSFAFDTFCFVTTREKSTNSMKTNHSRMSCVHWTRAHTGSGNRLTKMSRSHWINISFCDCSPDLTPKCENVVKMANSAFVEGNLTKGIGLRSGAEDFPDIFWLIRPDSCCHSRQSVLISSVTQFLEPYSCHAFCCSSDHIESMSWVENKVEMRHTP